MSSSQEAISRLLGEELRHRSRHKPENLFRESKKIIERQAPEVMVKMTGAKKGAEHLKKHLAYITREGSVEAENQDGDIIQSDEDLQDLMRSWLEGLNENQSKNRRTAMAFVLSMPAGTDVDAFQEAVRNTAKQHFSNHDYIMVLHDENVDHHGRSNPNPHGHLTVSSRGYDGRQLHMSNEDTRIMRETFADDLEDQGIEAQATRRHLRGITKKGIPSPILHMAKRGDKTLKEMIKRDQLQIQTAINDGKDPLTPFDHRAIEGQKSTRKEWVSLASTLIKEDPEENKNFALNILNFVKNMPPIETQRQRMVSLMEAEKQAPQTGEKSEQTDPSLQNVTKNNGHDER